MTELGYFLDKTKKITIFDLMNTEERQYLEDQLKKINADLHFIAFVFDWYGWHRQGLPVGPVSESYKRKIKRHLQAKNVFDEKKWEDVLEGFKNLKNTKLLSTLFRRVPFSPNPKNRPEDIAKWQIVHFLRYYFKKLTGKYQMRLIAWLFGMEEDSLAQEWSRWKDKLLPSNQGTVSYKNGKPILTRKPFSPEDEFKKLEKLYLVNKERFKEVLRRGIPFNELYLKTVSNPPGVSEWKTKNNKWN